MKKKLTFSVTTNLLLRASILSAAVILPALLALEKVLLYYATKEISQESFKKWCLEKKNLWPCDIWIASITQVLLFQRISTKFIAIMAVENFFVKIEKI